ncbi:MAG TPA: DUF4251 domain-containing protein [Prolixibacteraceae bacterium]|nr:DUF4251 domain-containing protein [Prolixibacteraceae bacterium]
MMKTKTLAILLFCALPVFSQNTRKQERLARRAADFLVMKEQAAGRNFEFVADQALPSGGSSVDLFSNPNHVTFRGDSVFCDLPFFGRAYQVDFRFQGGFHLAGIPNEYTVTEKGKSIRIHFRMKDEFDNYSFNLTLTGPESATLTVSSNHRSTISYWGTIRKNESENAKP